ncbi:hypothetical protein [Lapidilactobacillus bayanensis]|uniref:hypothetical protein n=1 Tax=Lapidilactobacillus bayanensis TaxID=2485998 RepID=UPI000F787B09|nr:hypothetical protein [Lapidilactobacillus bayanensis]
MYVLDFLQLISDVAKQTPFFFKDHDSIYSLLLPEITEIYQQPSLLITTNTSKKSLRQWELFVLLNQPEYRQLPVYLQINGQPRAVFGFKLADGKAWLN